MQNLPLYQVDAFSDQLFGGNPAAVVPLPQFLPDEVMQKIAAENNLSETAFVVVRGPGKFDIRWFTPTMEVRLCGHATLASAHIMFHSGGQQFKKMHFRTWEAGTIVVTANGAGSYSMDFPADIPKKVRAPKGLKGILGGLQPVEVYAGLDDLMVVLKNQKQVKNLTPNFPMLASLKKRRGLLVTAAGKKHDFVSRGFFPAYGIDEDPVTGSAHTLLTPYWAKKLKKKRLDARQISARGGNLTCELKGKKVRLTGQAITYLSGQIMLENL
ncbi:PhzF family phenazine biosynthesis protein [Neolewinella persica]|uniref:PhzF family phenazine biosynthesis protein n=1 Tax=Neolewinella persica TaxID=70998 RepID=UPI0003820313|nr:PhzF family phenazine biosynthesis protein [Neolewinella persica]